MRDSGAPVRFPGHYYEIFGGSSETSGAKYEVSGAVLPCPVDNHPMLIMRNSGRDGGLVQVKQAATAAHQAIDRGDCLSNVFHRAGQPGAPPYLRALQLIVGCL